MYNPIVGEPWGSLLPKLREHPSVIVTGPSRSGTTVAARILADALGYKYVDENDFGIGNVVRARGFVAQQHVVLQAPGLCHAAHRLGCAVVIMRRNLEAIHASERRIPKWIEEQEPQESQKYGGVILTHLAELKYFCWDLEQKFKCISFDLDYESLRTHPMWIDPEKRKGFGVRQWKL
jgi:hypothetical protein